MMIIYDNDDHPKVPRLGSDGEHYRERQLSLQLPRYLHGDGNGDDDDDDDDDTVVMVIVMIVMMMMKRRFVMMIMIQNTN